MASGYDEALDEIAQLITHARRRAAQSVNAEMTATYWRIGQRIVQAEQRGGKRARYRDELIGRLAVDLTARYGRGFGKSNLKLMRVFFMTYSSIGQTVSGQLEPKSAFPLPWSHYARLLSVPNPNARQFYEVEALRGGWTLHQLERQIGSQFYP